MKQLALLLLAALSLTGCSIMPKEDRMMRSADIFNRFSRTTLVATRAHKFGDDKLKLRKNHTFTYRSDVMGIKNSYYCGKYHFEGGVLLLEFAEDRKPANLDKVMVLTTLHGWPYLRGANGGMSIKATDDVTETIRSLSYRPRRH